MLTEHPFTIRIFVAEGIPDGLRLIEKAHWSGICIICPRGRYVGAKERKEFSRSGVYILVGVADDQDQPLIYIGEAESVQERLNNHYANKDFWQQAIVFTTQGNPLNKAEVRYLEARLLKLARENKRCHLENSNSPQIPKLSEADKADIEIYLAEMLSLLPVIGIRAFEPARSLASDQIIYYYKSKGRRAIGYETSSGFVVQKGSFARDEVVPSTLEGVRKVRSRLIEDHVLVKGTAGYEFKTDHEFTSPSQAASVCAGMNVNGRIEWKDADGKTLKDHQELVAGSKSENSGGVEVEPDEEEAMPEEVRA